MQNCPRCRSSETLLSVWKDGDPQPHPTLECTSCGAKTTPTRIAFYGGLDFSIVVSVDRQGHAPSADEALSQLAQVYKNLGIEFEVSDVHVAGVDAV